MASSNNIGQAQLAYKYLQNDCAYEHIADNPLLQWGEEMNHVEVLKEMLACFEHAKKQGNEVVWLSLKDAQIAALTAAIDAMEKLERIRAYLEIMTKENTCETK